MRLIRIFNKGTLPSATCFLAALTLALSPMLTSIGGEATKSDRPALHNPQEIRSRNGVLKATFEVRPTTVHIGTHDIDTIAYNGEYIPPTLRVHPGDRIELTLRNSCNRPTNIHFHGFLVSPQDHADNIGIRVSPGETTTYKLTIPKNHSPGLYWYHSHAHGDSQPQVERGLCGAIIVEGLLETVYPQLVGVEEKVLAIRDMELIFGKIPQAITTSDPALLSVNGMVNPRITARPGQIQFWRVSNQSANRYYLLKLGGAPFYVIAEDGHRTVQMQRETEYLLAPSARVELLVQFGSAGTYALTTDKVRTGPAGDGYPAATLATVVCEGSRTKGFTLPMEPSCCAPKLDDLTTKPIAQHRTFVFSDGAADFRINDRTFDMNRIDVRVPLGNIEEWTVRNSSDELHQFHSHQVYFQVVEVNGKRQPFTGYHDTYPIPNRGEIKIIIPFTQRDIVGVFPFHCHILEHEDGGMMALIQVYDPKNPNAPVISFNHQDAPVDEKATGGAFALSDEQGVRRTEASWPGKALLMGFGYTHCNGACPLTLRTMTEVSRLLGPEADRMQPVLVTVDPERDTPSVLAAYAKESGLPITFLTGSRDETSLAWREFGVTAERQPAKQDGSYSVLHSTGLLIVGPDGKILARFSASADATEIAEKLRTCIAALASKASTGVVSATP